MGWLRAHRRRLLFILLPMITVVVGGYFSCIPPRAVKQVNTPREGRALNQRLAIVYSQDYQIDFGGAEKLHPFDINKYTKIYMALVRDGLLGPDDVFVPEPIDREDLLLVHTADYLKRLQQPAMLARYLEFGPAAKLPTKVNDRVILSAFRYATGGTLLAARKALQHGMAVNLAGGYHHAAPDIGGGFCIYADMPVAIRRLQREGLTRQALVMDLDAHQGNGTALCFQDDPAVFTFDMHEGDIFPIPKEKNDLDVPLPAGMTDAEYLEILRQHLPKVFELARPDIVFLQGGVDVLARDPLTRLDLSIEGVVTRDRLVFREAASRGIPIVMVLGGGYSDRAWYAQYQSIKGIIMEFAPGNAPTPQQAGHPLKGKK